MKSVAVALSPPRSMCSWISSLFPAGLPAWRPAIPALSSARLDLPAAEQRQDWAQWMTQEVRDADYVLVIASPDYKRRAEARRTR